MGPNDLSASVESAHTLARACVFHRLESRIFGDEALLQIIFTFFLASPFWGLEDVIFFSSRVFYLLDVAAAAAAFCVGLPFFSPLTEQQTSGRRAGRRSLCIFPKRPSIG